MINIKSINNGHIFARYLIDGTGTAIQKDRVITIKNSIIAKIEQFSPVMSQKITHNLSSHCIIPPLTDAHVHLTMSGTLDLQKRHSQLNLNFDQATKHISFHLKQYEKAGIIVLRDGGDRLGHTFTYKQNIDHRVDILSCGVAWYQKGRYGQFAGKGIDSNDNSLKIISSHFPGDHIKIIQSGINSIRKFGKQTAPQFSQDEMTGICQWARQNNTPVMVHANGVLPVKIAIQAGCTSIEHGYFMGEENLQIMADNQIFWVPTLVPMHSLAHNLSQPEEKDIACRTFDSQCEQIQKARALGVPIAIGSDSGSYGVDHGSGLFEEMKLMVSCGFSVSQVIHFCSSQNLFLFNRPLSGVLKIGENARFVAVKSRPEKLFEKIKSHK
ncbi:MAG: Amidohydrolase [Candidatus Magnetoglobus multicellularis str. Araruama]|uniref:Amidohydrolase n=1 Tax=Candidatus Magnetoglobus multicellularis str. Araruama TaxID=890399 RepID=A0A1V1PFQ2_9BACT|nr:MAG: Amidohydrolase [Candidatus Magnetoglobus multicellularis str. Araruama]